MSQVVNKKSSKPVITNKFWEVPVAVVLMLLQISQLEVNISLSFYLRLSLMKTTARNL